jgi:hypothetical protein
MGLVMEEALLVVIILGAMHPSEKMMPIRILCD